MDYSPVSEPGAQLSRLQQIVGVGRPAVLGLLDGEGLIDKDPSSANRFAQALYERPVKVVEHQDCPVVLFFQRILAGLEVDFLELRLDALFFGRFSGSSQGFGRPVREDHGEPQPCQVEPVLSSLLRPSPPD